MEDKISDSQIKKIFSISDNTLRSYIKFGILPNPEKSPYGEIFFDRATIARIVGLESMPDEPFLTTKEAIKVLGLSRHSQSYIKDFCDRRKIPYYYFKNIRGSKIYFLLSEVNAALEYSAKWGTSFPDFVARNSVITDVIKYVFNSTLMSKLKDDERAALRQMLLERKSLKDTALSLGCSTQNARRILVIGCKRALFEFKQMENAMKSLEKITEENKSLRSKSRVLLDNINSIIAPEDVIKEEQVDILARQIKSTPVDFSPSLRSSVEKFLERIGATTINDIVKYKRSEIQKYRNVGERTIGAIESILNVNGLKFKPEDGGAVKKEDELNLVRELLDMKEKIAKLERQIQERKQ